jgi:carbamate kinase
MNQLAVCAIGGNSLIKNPTRASFQDQYQTACETARSLADLAAGGLRLIVTHGNGPQVGFMLIRSHLSRNRLPEIPLDACNALTQAEIGYMLQMALKNEFRARGIDREVATIVTQVLVDADDPAFRNPSKPVGPFYTKREAMVLKKELNWVLQEDAGRGFRRYVPSPEPREIIERPEIETLVKASVIVIAVGGGGIPVVEAKNSDQVTKWPSGPVKGPNPPLDHLTTRPLDHSSLHGVAAVIDKDLASGLLATKVGAELLVISTSVEKVFLDYNQPNQTGLDLVKLADAEKYARAGQFPAGSMGPKIDAALRFLRAGGEQVVITDPAHLSAAVAGKAGTRIVV